VASAPTTARSSTAASGGYGQADPRHRAVTEPRLAAEAAGAGGNRAVATLGVREDAGSVSEGAARADPRAGMHVGSVVRGGAIAQGGPVIDARRPPQGAAAADGRAVSDHTRSTQEGAAPDGRPTTDEARDRDGRAVAEGRSVSPCQRTWTAVTKSHGMYRTRSLAVANATRPACEF